MAEGRLSTEIAHVLFLDLVGYSRVSMEEQARLGRELRALVRGTPEFQRANQHAELLSLDTGDGMALVFSRDPLAPAQCAVEIARVVRAHPKLSLRMGIHSGPVSRATDINGKENVSGSGINTAQRVMDCGDAGHILLSNSSAEVLIQFETWAASIHDIGACEVKHGARLHLYNLYTGEVGNPECPAKLEALSALTAQPPLPQKGEGPGVRASQQVALLYKRNAQPDEYVLKLLETQLSAHGFRVFVDRHMQIGVEWAAEIERQVRASYAVVPLLSEASVRSEMLEYEVETAHKAAQSQDGMPRILPVRVGYGGSLSEQGALPAILDPLHYALWQSPEDDARLVAEIVHALRNPPQPRPDRTRLEPAGGAVPLDSEFYIVRPTDEEFKAAIARRDSIVLVKGARQMGKTSLLARGLQQAREAGARVVLSDFQALNAAHLASPESLFLTLAEAIADQLDLDVLPDEVWNERRGANINLERYIRREVLGSLSGPLVWGMDEVDRLFSCPFGSEVFFGLFRSWHNRRSLDPAGPWGRLTLAIAYATEAHLFITDLNQSPFNVGTRLTLNDFTPGQVTELNHRYGSPLQSADEVGRFYGLLGGQPYLVNRGLTEMAAQAMDFAALEAQSDRDEGLFGDHLRRILVLLAQDAALTEGVRRVLRGEPCPAMESFYRLRSSGVLAGDSAQEARLRCQLYAAYLSRHLL